MFGDFLSALLGIGGGGLLTKDAIDRLSDIGLEARTGAETLAGELLPMTEFRPFTVTSATGGRYGVTTDPTGGTAVTMNLSPREQALQNRLLSGSSQFFNQAAVDPAERERQVYERMRGAQRPEEDRQRLALEERLASQGRLGVSSAMYGGAPEQLALAKAQEEAKNAAMLGAMGQAQREQMQQAALGQQFLGASYVPQAQLLNVQQASQLYPQLEQQQRLFGAGQYGETMMSGLEAQLIAEQAKANLLGGLGTGLLGGMFTPVAQKDGGATNVLTGLLGGIFGGGS